MSLMTIPSFIVTPARAQHAWSVEVVATGGLGYGDDSSIAVDTQNRPHISYSSGSPNETVMHAYRNDSGWTTEQVDSWGICPREGSSIALDSQDRPWIAYSGAWDTSCRDFDVRLAHWNGTAWEHEVVNPPGVNAAYWPSLAIDMQDRPHVAYYSDVVNTAYNLTYAVWNGSSWDYQMVEMTGWNSGGPGDISMKLDSNDWPHIAYDGGPGLGLRYDHWNGTRWVLEGPDSSANPYEDSISLDLDSGDLPHISYGDLQVYGVKYAHWNGSAWITQMISPSGEVGESTSIAVDSMYTPHVVYGHTGSLGPPAYVLYYTSRPGSSWIGEVADPTERVARPSIGIDSKDGPHVAYSRSINITAWELRYAFAPWIDAYPPVSHVLPVSPYWNGNPIQVNATDRTGVANVMLFYGYSPDNSSPPFYTSYATDTAPPWTFDFMHPNGEGYYSFFSAAVDASGNAEGMKGTAEAIMGNDITPPVSTALPISPSWHSTSPMSVDATATDNLSGVANVTLLYSHAPLDNTSWSAWTSFGTRNSPPWSWSFPFPDGKGNYRFHTIASDVAGNVEGAKTIAEAVAGYNGTPPVTMPDYSPINEQPIPPVRVGLSSPVYLSLVVHNGGNATASSDTVLAFYNSTPTAPPFRAFAVSPIASGGDSPRFTATWTSPATRGSYRVSVDVDYWNNVTEWNETNNVYTWTIEVVTGPITSLVIGNPNYTSPAMTTYVRSTTPLSLSVLDQSGLGIRNTTYMIDSGSPVNYTATSTFFLAGEGMHTIEWRSLDWAGNFEDASSMNPTVDDTPPATTIHQSEMQAITATLFTLTATDTGCGVNVTRYRIDSGNWTVYSGGFTLSEGEHNISYYSNDMLNNTERERWLVVNVSGPQPPPIEVAVNYKPIVAVIFAIILLVAGVWSSKRRPWQGGKDRMAVVKAFAITSLPFILTEAFTGTVSFLTGELKIPPYLGAGTAIDLIIIFAGLAVAALRLLKTRKPRDDETDKAGSS